MAVETEFVWWPAKGYGFHAPSAKFPYDEHYLEKKKARENTEVGRLLVQQRCKFVGRRGLGVVDVGVGAGSFVKANECVGYDVNPEMVQWLRNHNCWHDIYTAKIDTACFWDSLEHMLTPEAALVNVTNEVFISIPIFASGEHALKSKHFRPNEHLWYFTEWGLIGWMKKQGFSLLERSCDEERYGREGVGSYRFTRHP